jgi:hypothetical protein
LFTNFKIFQLFEEILDILDPEINQQTDLLNDSELFDSKPQSVTPNRNRNEEGAYKSFKNV